jgi:hypothetical protein
MKSELERKLQQAEMLLTHNNPQQARPELDMVAIMLSFEDKATQDELRPRLNAAMDRLTLIKLR